MFCIDYQILEEEKRRLSSIKNIKEFEMDFNNIEGQIQLTCNDKKIGFVNKEVSYAGELLITWFQKLNEVIIQLRTNEFVTMWIPDSADIWLEFLAIKKIIVVSQIKAETEMHIKKTVTNIPKTNTDFFWSENISREEFLSTVLGSTNEFLRDIISLNELLGETKEVMKLENSYQKATMMYTK